MKSAVFLLGLIAALIPSAEARRAIPENYLKYPVLVTMDNGVSSSGFYFNDHKGDIYFITARHVFFEKAKSKKEDASEEEYILRGQKALLMSYPAEEELKDAVFIELNLDQLKENILRHETQDVAAVQIGTVQRKGNLHTVALFEGVVRKGLPGQDTTGTILGAGADVIKKMDEILTGNEVFVFGYPTSLGIENYPQIDYNKPLLRKGVIAGKNETNQTIVLDCPIHYGNSGGPAIEAEETANGQTRFSVIGVVTEFVPFDHKWYYKRKPLFGKDLENSGYSIVVPMDTVLELIKKRSAPEEEPEQEK